MFIFFRLFLIAYVSEHIATYLTPADAIKVFARMSPQGKAAIIRAIQEANKDAHVFMCGDGGNDVGALKQVLQMYYYFIVYAGPH